MRIKLFTIMTVVILLVASCMTTYEVKADTVATFDVTSTTNSDGTITATVNIKSNPGLAGLSFKLNYDSNVLELVSAKGSNQIFTTALVNSQSNGFIGYAYIETTNETSTGVILTAKFKLKSNVTAKETTISLDNYSMCNEVLENVNASKVDCKISIGGIGNSVDNGSTGNTSANSGAESSTESQGTLEAVTQAPIQIGEIAVLPTLTMPTEVLHTGGLGETKASDETNLSEEESNKGGILKYILMGIVGGAAGAAGAVIYRKKHSSSNS